MLIILQYCSVVRDDLNDLTCLLNKEFIFIWLKSNKLSLNTQNTIYLLFHRERVKGNNSVVKINDSVLNRVNNMKTFRHTDRYTSI